MVHTTQMNSAFCVLWLAGLKVINKYSSPSSSQGNRIMHQKFNFQPFLCILTEMYWFFKFLCGIYSVHANIIIYLTVGESGKYLPSCFAAQLISPAISPPLCWIMFIIPRGSQLITDTKSQKHEEIQNTDILTLGCDLHSQAVLRNL